MVTEMERLDQLSAAEIARRIADGALRSQDVVNAFIVRLEQSHAKLNCLSARRFDEARQEAQLADEILAKKSVTGPLHGVPITIKDCFDVAGLPTAVGVDRCRGNVRDDCWVVQKLRNAGAIVLGKSTVPQLMMMLETTSPLHGETLHPTHADRTPGGSSGGEAAIIASGGSPLGIGTDMGGSVRIPAHFCGVCGFKPGSRILEMTGVRQLFPHTGALPTVVGPIARNVEDLVLVQQILRGPERNTLSMVRRQGLQGLRIAVWEDDPYFGASPSIRSTTRQAAEYLAGLGAELVPLSPPLLRRVVALFIAMASADGGASAAAQLRSSRTHPNVRKIIALAGLPGLLRTACTTWFRWRDEAMLGDLYHFASKRTVRGYWQLMAEVMAFRQEFLQTWQADRLDACLMPPFATVAFRRGASLDLIMAGGFAFLANLLDWPAGVVPAGIVTTQRETDRPTGGDSLQRVARRSELGSAGLPIAVQVMAGPGQETLVLDLMRRLEQLPRRHWNEGTPAGGSTDPRFARPAAGPIPTVPPLQTAG
jgi:fatty acid amide hydrolase